MKCYMDANLPANFCLTTRRVLMGLLIVLSLFFAVPSESSAAKSAAEIDQDVDIALKKLHQTNTTSQQFSEMAKAVLVFPDIIKGGFIIGGHYGTGALRINGKTDGYYQTVSASYGLQIGAQSFGYAMYFMTQAGLDYLKKSEGWEIGVGPSIVVMDEGMARSFSTSTAKDDIYVFFFDQKGIMAGIGLQGTKISPYSP